MQISRILAPGAGVAQACPKFPRPSVLRLVSNLALGVAALLAVSQAAWAQAYPTRPITIVNPFAAGGPTDAVVRTLSERMRVSLGQPLIVENVTGAAGTIGVGRVARAAPDGYTVSVGHWSTHVINGALYSLPFDLLKDLEPIALFTSYPMLLLTKNDVPAKNLTELTSWLKANQEKVSVGTIGVGSAAHVAAVYYEHLAGLKFAYVPYRGAAPALQDLIAGRIDLLFDHLPNALPQVREGKVKAYEVTANTRSPQRLISRRWMKPAIRAYTLISGTASGSRRAHRQRSRPSSMPLSWMPLPTRRYASSSLN